MLRARTQTHEYMLHMYDALANSIYVAKTSPPCIIFLTKLLRGFLTTSTVYACQINIFVHPRLAIVWGLYSGCMHMCWAGPTGMHPDM